MKSVVIHAAKDLRIEDRPSEEPGAGQVEVRVAAGGICGSDLHYYNHGGFGSVRLKEPMVLGHEVAGHITRLGEGVTGLRVGQLVAVSPSRPCHGCAYCSESKHNQCLNMRFYGSAMPFPHIQGAFREVLVADATQCAPADGLSAGEAAAAEPLAVCLHAARRAGGILGKRVLVTGCGPIGLLCILVARRSGAAEIVATDLSDFTLRIARQNGADNTVNVGQTPERMDAYEAGKGYFDLLFECTGVAQALAGGIAALRPGGTVVQLGLGGDMQIPVQTMTTKEIQFRGSFRFHEEFCTGVELMRRNLIDVKPLITHTVAIDDSESGFQLASDRNQAVKVQIAF
ncbi:MAG: L-idonate 5-dehydrogenase [Boseongicola sp. SB0677_bin_26]|nr:L-idonate 5-dehydrogenase [Boseongicola sp. SB0665_bin_10]MYG25783.1 L-idonate 5-dehydrogenase [Boseongicola sp. SB0677_bin_26]